MGARGSKNLTVQQSVQPYEIYVPINVTQLVAGTPQIVITYGARQTLEAIRQFSFLVNRDCYIELNGNATVASLKLLADEGWAEADIYLACNHLLGEQTRYISVLNANPGQLVTIRGMVWGY